MSNIEELKVKLAPIFKANDVKRSSVFGSVARGEAKSDSARDILIGFIGDKSLFDLIGLEQTLEDELDRKVDLLTYRSIHPLLKDVILKDEVKIYG